MKQETFTDMAALIDNRAIGYIARSIFWSPVRVDPLGH